MAQQSKATLKTYFETGDIPTETQFIDLIDSLGNKTTTSIVMTPTTTKGQAVTATGALAKADSATTAQCIGLAAEGITAAASGEIVTHGLLEDLDTSSFSAGEILYLDVSTAGALTSTAPTTGFVTEVGTCVASDVSEGSILVAPKVYAKATITEEVFVLAQALTSATTNGPEAVSVDYATSGATRSLLAFDSTTSETAYVDIKLPTGWDEGTITFTPYFSQASTSAGAVVWQFQAISIADGESNDVAFSNPQTSTKTSGTVETQYIGPATSAVTVTSPAEGDIITVEVARLPANGSDTLAVDAYLHGVLIKFTRNSVDDA